LVVEEVIIVDDVEELTIRYELDSEAVELVTLVDVAETVEYVEVKLGVNEVGFELVLEELVLEELVLEELVLEELVLEELVLEELVLEELVLWLTGAVEDSTVDDVLELDILEELVERPT